MPGAWVHIMQHASNHRPATIDANIQLSAWLRSYREFIHLLNVEHHHPRPLLLVLCRWYSSSILINTKTKYLKNHMNAAFSSFFLNETSCIYHRDMKIRTDRRQLVEVPFSKECEYQNRRSPVLSIVAYNLHVSILTEAECCANTITALSLDITMCSNIAPARYNLLLIKANTETIDNVTYQPPSPSP